MATPAISVQVLPAAHGDSLLVECPVGRRRWRMLVDTGPDECWPRLRAALEAIPPGADGRRRIDVAVISHVDHDHIGCAARLFGERSLGLEFGDVWFNAPPRVRARGIAEGQALAGLLGAPGVELPWNLAFDGLAAVTPAEAGFLAVPSAPGQPRITLLSPGPAQLQRLFAVWQRELERLRSRRPDAEAAVQVAPVARGIELDPAALAARHTAVDRAPANGSSIAFLLEHRGASLLLAADAFATVLGPALQALRQQRGLGDAWRLDAVKLSHHGSRANVTVDLLKAAPARHYIVSTNGAIFGHPDDEAVARVVVHGGTAPTLWFNFDTERTRRWADPALRARCGHSVVLPVDAQSGVRLALARHR
jgi:beta-lactamase superfamily II metal-dependent hydrolase